MEAFGRRVAYSYLHFAEKKQSVRSNSDTYTKIFQIIKNPTNI